MNPKTIVSALLFVACALALAPSISGIPLHEWIGIAAFGLTAAHCALNADWIVRTVKGAFHRQTLAKRGAALLNLGILLAFAAASTSGLLISATVLPAFGYFADGYYYWQWLHALSAKVLLALLLVHLVLHWRIAANAFTRKEPRS